MNSKEQLLKKMAKLESMNDQLLSELSYMDHLMRTVGFANGLETVKLTAKELIRRENEEEMDETDEKEAV